MFTAFYRSKIFINTLLLLLSVLFAADYAFAEERSSLPQVGSSVYFGKYEQNADTSDGPEALEWRVLDRNEDEGTLLLITTEGIEHVKYNQTPVNEDKTRVTWDRSSLRAWLNDDFYSGAFNDEEKSQIITTMVKGVGNKYGGVLPGVNTEDHIFILSWEECKQYFAREDDCICSATVAACENGADVIWPDLVCWWWVRDPGEPGDYAMHVHIDGSVQVYGNRINCTGGTVRPCIWVRWE